MLQLDTVRIKQYEAHPCMSCKYGGVWTENNISCGNFCKHEEITSQKGLFYGKYHSYKIVPKWCPKKEVYISEKCVN